MLVGLPILFVAAAMAIVEIAAWLRARPGVPSRAAFAVPALAGILTVAWPLPEFLAVRHTLALPDTRHLARKWINANITVDRPMAVELYGPIFQPDERTMLIWPFFATQVPLVRPAYHPEFLDGLVDSEVKDALTELPEKFRSVVLLDVEGFSYKEIAEMLDIPIGTVMSRLHRGRKFLQKRLVRSSSRSGIRANGRSRLGTFIS